MTSFLTTDGRTFTAPDSWPEGRIDKVIGLDAEGTPIAFGNGMAYGLTLCCGASFKGMEWGIGCRGCHMPAEGNDTPWGEVSVRTDRPDPRVAHLAELTDERLDFLIGLRENDTLGLYRGPYHKAQMNSMLAERERRTAKEAP